MSDGMTHEQAREALEALALDALDASERDAVMAHVATLRDVPDASSPRWNARRASSRTPPRRSPCRRRNATGSARGSWRAPPPTADRREPLGRARRRRCASRLASAPARADAHAAPAVRAGAPHVGPAAWMAMAASLVAILGVGAFLNARRERDALREALADRAARANGAQLAALDSLRATLDVRDRMIANLTGPQVAVMTLASTEPGGHRPGGCSGISRTTRGRSWRTACRCRSRAARISCGS